MNVEVTVTGPLFDGRLAKDIADGIRDADREIAVYAEGQVRQRLGQVLRHPSGRYQHSIHTLQRAQQELVTDGGIVYGPWLEGTGKRNRASRFKGYFTFRRVAQQVQAKAREIAERAIDRRLK